MKTRFNCKKAAFVSVALLIFHVAWLVFIEPPSRSPEEASIEVVYRANKSKVDLLCFFLKIEMKDFQKKYGRKAANSAEFLKSIKKGYSKNLLQPPLLDHWGNEYQFIDSNGKIQIISLGKDNQPGGVSLDQDYDLLDEKIDELYQEELDRIQQSDDVGFYFLVFLDMVFIFFLFYYFARDKRKNEREFKTLRQNCLKGMGDEEK